MFLHKFNASVGHFVVFTLPFYIYLFLNNEMNESIAPQMTRSNLEIAVISIALGLFMAVIFRLPERVKPR
jgi:uncharacterized membrane protein SpoIIM required for sporulation